MVSKPSLTYMTNEDYIHMVFLYGWFRRCSFALFLRFGRLHRCPLSGIAPTFTAFSVLVISTTSIIGTAPIFLGFICPIVYNSNNELIITGGLIICSANRKWNQWWKNYQNNSLTSWTSNPEYAAALMIFTDPYIGKLSGAGNFTLAIWAS